MMHLENNKNNFESFLSLLNYSYILPLDSYDLTIYINHMYINKHYVGSRGEYE